MNWLARFGAFLIRSSGATTLSNPEKWFIDWAGGGSASSSGIAVGPDSAQADPTFFAGIQVRCQDLAKLPLILYRRRRDGKGRDRATDHPLYNLVGTAPNEYQTSFEWREMKQAAVDLRGNAYSRIVRDGRYRPAELIPLHNSWVRPLRTGGDVFYGVRMYGQGKEEILPAREILHIKDRSDDGFCGKSIISRQRDTVGLSLAQNRHGAKVFANGARPGGLLIPKGASVGAEGRKLLEDEWDERHAGVENASRIAVLGEEFEYKDIGMSNADAEYLESRKFSRQEIAAILRVPPHKVGVMDNATFSNIEHQSLEYVTDTLMPIARRWEMALNKALLRESERADYFFEFLFDSLLRGDFLSRMQGYQIQRQLGVSYNEIASHENWEPVPAEQGGDERLVPLNMWPMGQPRPEKTAAPAPDPSPSAKASEPSNFVPMPLRSPQVSNFHKTTLHEVVEHDSKGRIKLAVTRELWEPIAAELPSSLAGEGGAPRALRASGAPGEG